MQGPFTLEFRCKHVQYLYPDRSNAAAGGKPLQKRLIASSEDFTIVIGWDGKRLQWRRQGEEGASTVIFDGQSSVAYSKVFDRGFIHPRFGGLEVTHFPIAWPSLPLVPFVREVSKPGAKGHEALYMGKVDPATNATIWQSAQVRFADAKGDRLLSIVYPSTGDPTLIERKIEASGHKLVNGLYVPTNVRQQDMTERLRLYGNVQQVDRETTFTLSRTSLGKLEGDTQRVVPGGATVQVSNDRLVTTFDFNPSRGPIAQQGEEALRLASTNAQKVAFRGSQGRNAPYAAVIAILLTVLVVWALRQAKRRGL